MLESILYIVDGIYGIYSWLFLYLGVLLVGGPIIRAYCLEFILGPLIFENS